jgi:hypothetical protein
LFGLGSPFASTAAVYFPVEPPTWISPLVSPAFTFVLTFIAVFSFLENLMLIARLQSPMRIVPLVAPALTFVLIFTVVCPFLEKLTLPRFSARHYQEPIWISPSAPALTLVLTFTTLFLSLKIRIDCQASAVDMDIAFGPCLDVGFNFHNSFPFFENTD